MESTRNWLEREEGIFSDFSFKVSRGCYSKGNQRGGPCCDKEGFVLNFIKYLEIKSQNQEELESYVKQTLPSILQ